MDKKIKLFWWSEIYLTHKTKENFGDLVGKYLVEKITSQEVQWVHPKKRGFINYFQTVYFTAGSILAHINGPCEVWGSGIISKDIFVNKAKFHAVRGPQTRNHLLSLGYDVPEIYGDPAILLPLYFKPEKAKKYTLALIPHYKDLSIVQKLFGQDPKILIIDLMTLDIEEVICLILQADRVISSSLHGIIVSHAYNIEAVWVKFSDLLFGDGVKFQDYFESVNIIPYLPVTIESYIEINVINKLFTSFTSLPDQFLIAELQLNLLKNCPFKNDSK